MASRVRPVNNVNRVYRKSNNEERYKRKRSRCYVENCNSSADTSIHTVTSTNRELRNSWMKALKFNPFFKGTIYVCENHFKDNDFAQLRGYRSKVRLKHNAVPSINLPKENSKIAVGDVSLLEELNDLEKENIPERTVAVSVHSKNATKDSCSSYEQEILKTVDMEVGTAFNKLNREVINNVSETSSVISKPILVVDVDFDMEEDMNLTEEENRIFTLMEEETVKQYQDKCLQTNLAYDESLTKATFVDMLKSDEMLDTWTNSTGPTRKHRM